MTPPVRRSRATRRLALAVVTLLALVPLAPPAYAATAPDRRQPHAWISTRGSLETFGLESALTRRSGELVRFTDHLSPGQAVRCRLLTAHVATVRRNGAVDWTSKVPLDVTRCGRDPDPANRGGFLVQASARSTRAGQLVVVAGSAYVPRTPAAWSHRGRVAQHGQVRPFRATRPAPVPAPPPAPPPTPSTSATPTPSATPSPGPSSSPAPSPAASTTRPSAQAQASPRANDPDDGLLDARSTTLLGGLLIFVIGALGVTLGLRRRGGE